MAPEVLELYVFIHYNWQYEFVRPSIDEIVKAYLKVYGAEAREEDLNTSSLAQIQRRKGVLCIGGRGGGGGAGGGSGSVEPENQREHTRQNHRVLYVRTIVCKCNVCVSH